MAEYIIVVRNPNAPGVTETTTGYRRWAEVFAEIFFETTLKPEVFEVIERTGTTPADLAVYNRTQLEAVATAVDDWTDENETWRSALP